tara:strand:+ start:3171 stop:4916 length:1746 start_codon:yes stop_codon:yes gene_type:complete
MKSFKEYYGGGIRVGGADSIVPSASLGDGPPKGQGGRDMRGVGLHASAGVKYLIYQTGNVGKTARIVMKNLKDIQTARDWIKDNGHSFDHKGKNFRIYQYKGSPNNIRPDDLIENFTPTGQQKVSDLIFIGSASNKDDQIKNLWIPISSAMFQRVFPKMVRTRIFHVTGPERFEQLYRIQNSKRAVAGFQQMTARTIQSGIVSGAGVCVELEGNALVSSANDLGSIPVVGGRRFISFDFFFDSFNKETVPGMANDLKRLIKTLIDKYADPNINKKRTSPYFTDYEVFKSIKASRNWSKGEGGKEEKESAKKMYNCVKDYFDGIERILRKHQKKVQEALTGYLKRRNTNRNWDEIVVDDFNILKVFIVKDHEETHIFKKDQLDHEAFKKELQFIRVPVLIKSSKEIEGYVARVSKIEREKALRETVDLTKKQVKMVHKVADDLPKKDFRDRYGKKKGDAVRYGTATNMVKKKLGLEDAKRIPRKKGQPAGSDKHSDLYTDENPKGTIHGLGFTDSKKAKQSINKIKNSGKTHAHKMQAAIAMSQRAKVASQRAKDPEKKKDLGQAHKVYQQYIDTNKKSKDD